MLNLHLPLVQLVVQQLQDTQLFQIQQLLHRQPQIQLIHLQDLLMALRIHLLLQQQMQMEHQRQVLQVARLHQLI